ncbi:hypothetical protein LCGC14_2311680 [marine sediment metagenome]|uniref:Uncharacterized protein n=1 Tax=marine sediment metagenome TaxID=412755 RepID=A0A0F9CKJ3_9ZZZZ
MKDEIKCLPTNNGWSNTIIDKVIKTGAHNGLNISDKDFVSSINTLLTEAGLVSGINVSFGYENNTKEDMILNLHCIIKAFKRLQGG